MRVSTLAILLMSLPAVALAQNLPRSEPIVQVGLYGYRSDGSLGASAYDSAPELSSIVYLNAQRCLMGAGNRPAPPDATDVWQFSGKVLSSTTEQAVVQLDWRRTVANGLRTDGNESSLQLNLRDGEVVPLDQVGIGAKPGCSTMAVAFEARYTPRFSGMGFPAGGVGGGSGVSGGTGVVSGRVTSTVRPASGGGFGTSVAVPQAGGETGGVSTATGSGLFDVNLWLVRALPGRPEEARHSTMKMNREGASFSFAPVPVTTRRGEVVLVQVSGSLTVESAANGEEQLVFRTIRRVSPSTNGQAPRDGSLDSHGTSSRITNRMPGPEEVLSFEMPPLNLHGQLVAPDQFSVRLTVARRRPSGKLPDR